MPTILSNLPQHIAATALLLMLGACGGGGSASSSKTVAPLSVDARRQVSDLMYYCQIREPQRTAPADQSGYSTSLYANWSYGEAIDAVTTLYAWGDGDTDGVQTLRMTGEFEDQRERSTGNYPSLGVADDRYGMGVVIPAAFADQSVGCVKSVSQLRATTFWTPTPEYPRRPGTLVWESLQATPVPVNRLPSSPIDGFEFVANFTPVNGMAYFAVRKSSVADASLTQVCSLKPGALDWQCVKPTVGDTGDGWQISVPNPKPGLYMLVSTVARRGA